MVARKGASQVSRLAGSMTAKNSAASKLGRPNLLAIKKRRGKTTK